MHTGGIWHASRAVCACARGSEAMTFALLVVWMLYEAFERAVGRILGRPEYWLKDARRRERNRGLGWGS